MQLLLYDLARCDKKIARKNDTFVLLIN